MNNEKNVQSYLKIIFKLKIKMYDSKFKFNECRSLPWKKNMTAQKKNIKFYSSLKSLTSTIITC